MYCRLPFLTWLHLHLLLGERILALRAPPCQVDQQASQGEVQSNGTTPPRQVDQPALEGEVQSNGTPAPGQVGQPASEGEVQSNGTTPPGEEQSNGPPSERAEGGCRALKKDGCAWLFCKHEDTRAALERKKHESEVEFGVSSVARASPREDERRRFVAEKIFLSRKETQRLLYKAMIYIHKGRHCEWALDSAKFEGWLEKLFPSRSRCVKEVIRDFEPDEEMCAEGFANNFKKELRENCKDDDEINYYQAVEEGAGNQGTLAAGVGGILLLLGGETLVLAPILLLTLGMALFYAGLVVLSIVGLGAFILVLCKRLGRNWKRFRNRPKKRDVA